MIRTPVHQVEERAARLAEALKGSIPDVEVDVAPSVARSGGGTLPMYEIPSFAVRMGGTDAEALVREGTLSLQDVAALMVDVIDDLAAKGFRVLDTKPNHIILRTRPHGNLLRRSGRLAYALVDFELLQRTESYSRWRGSAGSRCPPPTSLGKLR